MDNVINIGYEIIKWIQMLGVPATAIALGVGGLNHIFGGKNGFEKAKSWYIGGSVGLVFILGSTTLAEWLKSIMQF
ncbi:MAG: hypothetical protein ACRCX2_29855 [Paraclostridium sp.]